MSLKSKMVKPSEKLKLIKELQITEADIEFLLIAIKNSMIPGANLEQAVTTIEKLQNIYKKLQTASQGQSGSQHSSPLTADKVTRVKDKKEE
tara:strand:+ start:412 stop:687 length:276 start_codon:yes stop_codon:yes gene_type:complete